MNADTASKLHDFYQPPPPSWMPQTIGWYVLFAAISVALAWWVLRAIRKWKTNRYRREALQLLPLTPVSELSVLLKRTALKVWPREAVAPLTGSAWLAFLNRSTATPAFAERPATAVEEIALREESLAPAEEAQLRERAARWIRNHHVPL